MASQSFSQGHHYDEHFPLLEGIFSNTASLIPFLGPAYQASNLFSHSLRPVLISYGSSTIDRRTCLNIGQMNRADLKGWFEYLESLGLTVLLDSRDGRRVFRYLVDLAYQTHICAILSQPDLHEWFQFLKQLRLCGLLTINNSAW